MEWTLEQVDQMRTGRHIYGAKDKGGALALLRTAKETSGEYTLLYGELGPGYSIFPHYHTVYTETFKILEGRLPGLYGDRKFIASSGEEVVITPGTLHGWGPLPEGEARVIVELRPAHEGFEKWVTMLHNMGADGLTNPDLRPKSFAHVALFLVGTDTRLGGSARILNPLFKTVAWFARKAGVDRRLEEKYYHPGMISA